MYISVILGRETIFTSKTINIVLFQTGPTIPMPVPASYNDITQDKAIRDHVGIVWYDRTFYVPQTWNSNLTKVWLRFGGVHYAAEVVRSYPIAILCLFVCLFVCCLSVTQESMVM